MASADDTDAILHERGDDCRCSRRIPTVEKELEQTKFPHRFEIRGEVGESLIHPKPAAQGSSALGCPAGFQGMMPCAEVTCSRTPRDYDGSPCAGIQAIVEEQFYSRLLQPFGISLATAVTFHSGPTRHVPTRLRGHNATGTGESFAMQFLRPMEVCVVQMVPTSRLLYRIEVPRR